MAGERSDTMARMAGRTLGNTARMTRNSAVGAAQGAAGMYEGMHDKVGEMFSFFADKLGITVDEAVQAFTGGESAIAAPEPEPTGRVEQGRAGSRFAAALSDAIESGDVPPEQSPEEQLLEPEGPPAPVSYAAKGAAAEAMNAIQTPPAQKVEAGPPVSSAAEGAAAAAMDAVQSPPAQKVEFPAAPVIQDEQPFPAAPIIQDEQPAAPSEDMEAKASEYFQTMHGTAFDQNSSVDRAKMEVLRKRLESPDYAGLDALDFALKAYREDAA